MYSALNDRGAEETALYGKIVLFPVEVHTEATQTIFVCLLDCFFVRCWWFLTLTSLTRGSKLKTKLGYDQSLFRTFRNTRGRAQQPTT